MKPTKEEKRALLRVVTRLENRLKADLKDKLIADILKAINPLHRLASLYRDNAQQLRLSELACRESAKSFEVAAMLVEREIRLHEKHRPNPVPIRGKH